MLYYIIKGLKFEQTCSACPEAYDVFRDDIFVGYVRLRHGVLRAYYGSDGYNAENMVFQTYDLKCDGEFFDAVERMIYLHIIADIIKDFIESE